MNKEVPLSEHQTKQSAAVLDTADAFFRLINEVRNAGDVGVKVNVQFLCGEATLKLEIALPIRLQKAKEVTSGKS
jgi:hypothetical protein